MLAVWSAFGPSPSKDTSSSEQPALNANQQHTSNPTAAAPFNTAELVAQGQGLGLAQGQGLGWQESSSLFHPTQRTTDGRSGNGGGNSSGASGAGAGGNSSGNVGGSGSDGGVGGGGGGGGGNGTAPTGLLGVMSHNNIAAKTPTPGKGGGGERNREPGTAGKLHPH